jgi:beta-lactamase regulating signal transducer with metallopeptidase domain
MDVGGPLLLTLVSQAMETLARGWATAWSGLWMGALAATILAAAVSAMCRSTEVRPATRHALWLAVLVSFLTPSLAAMVWRPSWFASTPVATPPDALTLRPTQEPVRSRSSEPSSDRGPRTSHLPGESPARSLPEALPSESELLLVAGAAECAERSTPAASPACSAPDVTRGCDASSANMPSEPVARTSTQVPSPPPQPDISALLAASAISVPDHTLADATERQHRSSSAPQVTTLEPAPSPFSLWADRLIDVRDAIAALPPIPFTLWAVGALAVAALYVVRARRVCRIVRRAFVADPHIEREVAQVARSLGLERAPRTLVTHESISPLVWCGVRPCVVLPLDLWESFDRAARRTVLVHELAHLRRGDHRIAWLEALVAILYWWHPLAWWVRARIRDSAETACDTWVTALCPQNRRNYAEAIVLATSFLSNTTDRTSRAQHAACASVSVGFVTGRSRRLARRITMIMTSRFAPRMSLAGTVGALFAIGLGAFVAPSLACPPSECETNAAQQKAKAEVKAAAKAEARDAKKQRKSAATGEANSPFLGEAPAIDAMEAPGHGSAINVIAPRAARAIAIAPGPRGTVGPLSDALHGLAVVAPEASDSGETFTHRYVLPEGKLEALIELMSREDVPVLIENPGDAIIVHGTQRQHEIFAAFVHLIHPEGKQVGGRWLSADSPAAAEANLFRYHLNRADAQRELYRNAGQLEHARAALEQAVRERTMIETQAEALRLESERASERSEELREALGNISEQRSNMARFGDAQAERALAEAMRSVEGRVRGAEQEAQAKEAAAVSIESRMASLEDAIARLEERLEALAETVDEANEENEADEENEVSIVDTLTEFETAMLPTPVAPASPPAPPALPAAAAQPAPPAPPAPTAPPASR